MDSKAKKELIASAKNAIGIVAALYDEEGVRIIGKVVEEWLAKKAKTTKKRKKRKKSKRKIKFEVLCKE